MASLVDGVQWPVSTARLVLRPATPDDVDATWAVRRLEAVTRWLMRAPASFDAHREQFLQPDSLAKTLVMEQEGVLVGDLMVTIGDAWAQAEVAEQSHGVQAVLGWTLDPAWTGQGFATEAVDAVLRICFEDLGLRRVIAECFAANEPSWRLMERVGMRREAHTVRDSLHRSGEWLDGFSYALLAEEWRAGRSST